MDGSSSPFWNIRCGLCRCFSLFLDNLFWGAPTITSITSNIWSQLCYMLHITHSQKTAYHPESKDSTAVSRMCYVNAATVWGFSHHDIWNIPLCEDYCTRSSSRYSNIPLAKKIQYLCSYNKCLIYNMCLLDQYLKIFSATLLQASMPQHEHSVSVLKYKNHILWL